MTKRAFVDSDVILDVALARQPFVEASRLVLSLLEDGRAVGFISSNSTANIYYVLRKAGGDQNARKFLLSILKYLTVIPTDHNSVLKALHSEFGDFEDAVQHFTAVSHQCSCIVTRNGEDYKKSELDVYLPIEFLSGYE